ncbi:MAG: ABC transporter substrate-binding protein, partial [Oligoflexus sp.]
MSANRLPAQNEYNSQQSSVDTSDLELCSKLYKNSIIHYQQLARRLPPQFKWKPHLASHQVIAIQHEACGRPDTTVLFQKVLGLHSGKIGILLPLSRWPQPVRMAVMEQVQNLARSLGWDPEKSLVWLDTEGSRDRLDVQLAQLVFTHHVSVVIGGLTTQEAPHLAKWADHLRLPAIVLNRRFDELRSKYVFYMGPDLRLLSSTLTRHTLSRGMKRIAVLMPQNSRDGQLVQYFQEQAQHLRITIEGPYLYNPADYASIEEILRKLFRIDDPTRGQ